MFEPKLFYNCYLDDFHKFKAILYEKMLSDLPNFEKQLFGEELEPKAHDAFQKTIKSDLRQTYFHAIESFFEIFFALISNGSPTFDDKNILFTLTNSNWKTNYDKITSIASGKMKLDFLDNIIEHGGQQISVGHYLFYYGTFRKEKFGDIYREKVSKSIEAIKFGMKVIAADFVDREEYNSYKHGLRIIPAITELMFADAKTMESKIAWNLKDSMSFYSKSKNKDELTVKTKLFDSVRDTAMTHFCSNMISNIIYYRQLSMYKELSKEGDQSVRIVFFGKEEIENCNKINVDIQNLVYSVSRVDRKDQS